MSFDLYKDEIAGRTSLIPGAVAPEPGVFDNFLTGTAKYTMQGFAKAGRAVDLLGSVGPIVQDRFTGGTEAQDRYFQEHDEVFSRAVDYWTPKPGEVGAAAEVAGSLLSTLPLVIASPGLAVGATQLSTGEDLVRKGVDAGKAGLVGAVQGAGLGLGIWMPILGQTGWQRMVLGGAGFNVVQGVATRGVSGAILSGTAAAEDFKGFDWSAVTTDALLGLAFGGLAHISPAQRAQGAAAWQKLGEWAKSFKPSDIDALATLRVAEHLNKDSLPGKPAGPADIEAHVTAMRQAIDDLVNDRPVNVEETMAGSKFEPDPERVRAQEKALATLERVLPPAAEPQLPPARMEPAGEAVAAQDVSGQPGPGNAPERIPASPDSAREAKANPLAAEAERFIAQYPDMPLHVGSNVDASPITMNARQYLDQASAKLADAKEGAKLIDAAAACLLGAS